MTDRNAVRRTALALAVAGLLVPGLRALVVADPNPNNAGTVWQPAPQSKELYATKPPDEDPDVQRHVVEAADGVDLYVETWLPTADEGGPTPPAKVPTVLVMTPYVSQGVEAYGESSDGVHPAFISYMTKRGYAVAQHHVRGTGESGGCLEQTAANQIDDGARVVEYLGRDAPWSNGSVGMYGVSYDAETQVSVAGFGDPEKTKWLKAIVPVASVGGQYEWSFYDGVPYTGFALQGNVSYLAGVSIFPGQELAPQHYPEKLTCQPELMLGSADVSGDMTPFWAAREYRPGRGNVTAPTLYVHGLRDFNVQPITAAGWYDHLPASTPHKGLFGVWNHALPYAHSVVEPDWERTDWLPMALAWYDRYLKQLATGVEEWPDVQVQASDGQWRAERNFPATGGPVGQLALGADGALGVTAPAGETAYTEALTEEDGRAVFTTPNVTAPLHLTGQPVLDLWLTTDQPDGHLAARIEVLDEEGSLIRHDGSSSNDQATMTTYGFRSLRHLEPMDAGYFAQAVGVAPPTDEPLHVEVRFLPTDLVVPVGGQLRVTVAGTITYSGRDSQPSGSFSTITLLHECGKASALRFAMPTVGAPLLDVREEDEDPLTGKATAYGLRDGGGLASAEVCGEAPKRLQWFGPANAGPARVTGGPPAAAPSSPPKPVVAPSTPPKPAPRPPLAATGMELTPMLLVATGCLALAAGRARRRRC